MGGKKGTEQKEEAESLHRTTHPFMAIRPTAEPREKLCQQNNQSDSSGFSSFPTALAALSTCSFKMQFYYEEQNDGRPFFMFFSLSAFIHSTSTVFENHTKVNHHFGISSVWRVLEKVNPNYVFSSVKNIGT